MTARANVETLAAAGPLKEINAEARAATFEFNCGTEGENTRIDYRLLDNATSKTVRGSVVLSGRVSDDDVADLRENLEEGRIFDPFRAGIPDLAEKMPASWKDGGTSVHVLDRIAYTNNAEADYLPTAFQFASALSEDYSQYLSTGSI